MAEKAIFEDSKFFVLARVDALSLLALRRGAISKIPYATRTTDSVFLQGRNPPVPSTHGFVGVPTRLIRQAQF
jgi:hypothetical protein